MNYKRKRDKLNASNTKPVQPQPQPKEEKKVEPKVEVKEEKDLKKSKNK